ncbi:MAG: FHA domain-containing protein [Planctomycetota bacterium]
MQNITLRVISGADRGHVFRELETPITLGREEGNVVQLNDERISRYHVKVQEDDGRLVLTDLDSTNGTRVNGHVCSLKILRYGDTITIGRTVLLVGSKEQVAEIIQTEQTSSGKGKGSGNSDDSNEFEDSTGLHPGDSQNPSSHEIGVPRGLSTGQAAELREMLDHLHKGLGGIVESAEVQEKENRVALNQKAWQQLLMTQSEISELIRMIEEPPSSHPGDNARTGAD